MILTEIQWRDLIIRAWDKDQVAVDQFDTLWARFAGLDDADGSGELRYYFVALAGLDLAIAKATKDVSTQDGGGVGGQWGQHFDHLMQYQQLLTKQRDDYLKRLAWSADSLVGVMAAISLTPPLPGQDPYQDPGHPGYLGDPRYRRRGL